MNYKLDLVGSASAIIFASASWTEMNVILSAIASCLAILISLFTLISIVIKWFKKATEDGKITADELKEGIDIVIDGANEIKDQIESVKGKDNTK